MGKGKQILTLALTGVLLFFGGYCAGASSAKGGFVIYVRDAEKGVLPASADAAGYFERLQAKDESVDETAGGNPDGTGGEPAGETGGGTGAPGQPAPAAPEEERRDPPASGQPAVSGAAQSEGSQEANAALVNINTATAKELEALPGIGGVKSEAIVSYRQQNGPFLTKEELMAVHGIGEATFAKIRDLITI